MNWNLVMQARDEIDALDEQLSGLLLRRRKLSAAVIRERMCQGRPMRDLSREREIRRAAIDRADSPAAAQFLDAIFQCVLAEAPTPQKLWQLAAQPGGCVKVGAASFGAGTFELIAGPCAVENEEQLMAAARAACDAGARVLRDGPQALLPEDLLQLAVTARAVVRAVAGRCEAPYESLEERPGWPAAAMVHCQQNCACPNLP